MDDTIRQYEPDPPPPSGPQGAPEDTGLLLRLVLQPGGMVVELTQADTLIGRHSAADIRLPLPDVSRRHCRIVRSAGRWRVVDLNSLNGVYLNEESVQEAELRDGDRLRVGGFTFAVELPAAADVELLKRLFPGRPGISYLPPRRQAS